MMDTSLHDTLTLIRMEYLEMPDMRLTARQVRRLFNLTEDGCQRALDSLVGTGFLACTEDGAYLLRSRFDLSKTA